MWLHASVTIYHVMMRRRPYRVNKYFYEAWSEMCFLKHLTAPDSINTVGIAHMHVAHRTVGVY
jgi:hypothetical protein